MGMFTVRFGLWPYGDQEFDYIASIVGAHWPITELKIVYRVPNLALMLVFGAAAAVRCSPAPTRGRATVIGYLAIGILLMYSLTIGLQAPIGPLCRIPDTMLNALLESSAIVGLPLALFFLPSRLQWWFRLRSVGT